MPELSDRERAVSSQPVVPRIGPALCLRVSRFLLTTRSIDGVTLARNETQVAVLRLQHYLEDALEHHAAPAGNPASSLLRALEDLRLSELPFIEIR